MKENNALKTDFVLVYFGILDFKLSWFTMMRILELNIWYGQK